MNGGEVFYVGSYTGMSWCRGEKGAGIYKVRLNTENGEMVLEGVTGGLINPSFSLINNDRSRLYAINEVEPVDEEAVGRVTTFRIKDKDGYLEYMSDTSSYGLSPCYMALDKDEKNAFLTNYCGDCAVSIALNDDRTLGELLQKVMHSGSGSDKTRQDGPHPHSLALSRDFKSVIVADLGIDRLMIYDLSYDENSRPKMALIGNASVADGCGPRHILFNQDGTRLYVTCEMGSRVYVFAYDEKAKSLSYIQDIPSLPEECPGNCCAHLQLSQDGKYLYVSNRGHDSIAVYRVSPSNGTLEFIEAQPTGGATPRHFSIDPSGRFLAAANQDSNLLSLFARDAETGLLSARGQLKIPSPVNIVFL